MAPKIAALRAMLAGLALSAPSASHAEQIRHVIMIVMENTDAKQKGGSYHIYGNTEEAPYVNSVLMPRYAHAANFRDILPLSTPSEPHYVLMEAGTNVFDDFTFGDTDDGNDDPSGMRSTRSASHLTSQMRATDGRVTWMSYQEGLSAETGACPVISSGEYAAKHNPFVFFQGVSGNPPSMDNEYCAAHHRPYSALAADMAADRLANYVFITPGLCNDMHDECGDESRVKSGDSWLAAQLPAVIEWADAHDGVIFLAWDEGDETRKLPFLAIGRQVKMGFSGKAKYDHRSIVKTVGKIFGLPVLEAVKESRDLAELFEEGVMR